MVGVRVPDITSSVVIRSALKARMAVECIVLEHLPVPVAPNDGESSKFETSWATRRGQHVAETTRFR